VTARRSDEDGTVLVWLPALLVVAVLLGLATLEIGAHLVASARASALADAAALAAVSAQVDEPDVPPHGRPPPGRGRRAGTPRGLRLLARHRRAEVTVSVAVPGVVRPRLGRPARPPRADRGAHRRRAGPRVRTLTEHASGRPDGR
jgi:hypothetical protein